VEVSTRLTTTGDLAEVVRLVSDAHRAVADQRGGPHWLATAALPEPLTDTVADALAAPNCVALVGLIDDVPVGIALAHLDVWRDATRLGIVRYLYVEAEARQVGVGEALLDAIVEWARSHDCDALESMALPGDRELKNMFERYGLVARAIVVHRRLER
jgi:GNAT superfamily N-acetyltransferase